MARVPLGKGAFNRTFGRQAEIVLLNRFFEQSPANQTDGVNLLSRPGSTEEAAFGDGPIRKQFTLPGLLEGDLFIVSGAAFYRYDIDGNSQLVTGAIATPGTPSMTGAKGAGYQRVFIADGTSLQYYGGQAYSATLTLTPGTIADDTVRVDSTYYKFAADPTTGTPDGSSGNPYLVAVGGSNANALANLRKAINATGVGGTDYSVEITEPNERVTANANTSTTMSVRGVVPGPLDPIAPVSVSASGGADGLAWDVAQLTAGAHVLYGIPTPDDVGIVSVAELGSFILCVQANSDRVYFIRPGETTIDPLDFFTAESEADSLLEAIKVGDQVWLIGETSIEPWYLNGSTDPLANPLSKMQGRPFSIGAIEGTIVKLANSIFLVGNDQVAYRIEGGPQPISNPGIAERIRKALKAEKDSA
jgi:hypothetical protein